MNALASLQVQRGAAHLHRCGPRTIAEFLQHVARHTGTGADILAALREFETITPAMLRAAGGDRFAPRPLREVVP